MMHEQTFKTRKAQIFRSALWGCKSAYKQTPSQIIHHAINYWEAEVQLRTIFITCIISFKYQPVFRRGNGSLYPLHRMLSGFHSRFESVGENKYFCTYREPDPSFPTHFDKKKHTHTRIL